MPRSTVIREIKVPVSNLRVGMYVCRLDKPWIESSFLFQGFLIEDENLIKQIQKECHFVYIDENKGYSSFSGEVSKTKKGFSLKSLFKSATATKANQHKRETTYLLSEITGHVVSTDIIVPPKKLVAYDQEFGFARQTHTKISTLMNDFASQVKEGGTIDILIARQGIYDCMASVLRSPDAMQLVMRLKSKHKSSWQHSMNDSVLAISFGRYLNLSDDELVTLGLCGLLHDIGNLRISKQDLEEAENKKELVRSHTLLGREILLNCPGKLGEIVAEVAYTHHERLDGSGFPRGLKGSQISPYTRMISIIDVYNSLVNDNRSERDSLTHYDAISLMLKKANTHFDETLLNAFHQCIGTYPVGCVVVMSTGEIALVVEAHEELKLKPKVLLLTTPDKQPCTKKVINLADKTKTDDDLIFIKGIVQPEKYGIRI